MTLIATENQRFSNIFKFEDDSDLAFSRLAVIANEATAKTYVPGTVLARSLVSGAAATPTINTGSTGNATSSAITVGTKARPGVYTVLFTAATAFRVVDPRGRFIGTGATGAAFSADGISFTITAGGTAAVAGDSFSIVVTGTEKYKIVEVGTVDEDIVIVMANNLGVSTDIAIAATTDTTVLAIYRGEVIVADGALVLGSSFTTATQKQAVYSALEAKRIMVLKQI
jgi:hypothetical protein